MAKPYKTNGRQFDSLVIRLFYLSKSLVFANRTSQNVHCINPYSKAFRGDQGVRVSAYTWLKLPFGQGRRSQWFSPNLVLKGAPLIPLTRYKNPIQRLARLIWHKKAFFPSQSIDGEAGADIYWKLGWETHHTGQFFPSTFKETLHLLKRHLTSDSLDPLWCSYLKKLYFFMVCGSKNLFGKDFIKKKKEKKNIVSVLQREENVRQKASENLVAALLFLKACVFLCWCSIYFIYHSTILNAIGSQFWSYFKTRSFFSSNLQTYDKCSMTKLLHFQDKIDIIKNNK